VPAVSVDCTFQHRAALSEGSGIYCDKAAGGKAHGVGNDERGTRRHAERGEPRQDEAELGQWDRQRVVASSPREFLAKNRARTLRASRAIVPATGIVSGDAPNTRKSAANCAPAGASENGR
jgi:hypothetical protein